MSEDEPKTYTRESDGAVMVEIRPGRFRNAATHTPEARQRSRYIRIKQGKEEQRRKRQRGPKPLRRTADLIRAPAWINHRGCAPAKLTRETERDLLKAARFTDQVRAYVNGFLPTELCELGLRNGGYLLRRDCALNDLTYGHHPNIAFAVIKSKAIRWQVSFEDCAESGWESFAETLVEFDPETGYRISTLLDYKLKEALRLAGRHEAQMQSDAAKYLFNHPEADPEKVADYVNECRRRKSRNPKVFTIEDAEAAIYTAAKSRIAHQPYNDNYGSDVDGEPPTQTVPSAFGLVDHAGKLAPVHDADDLYGHNWQPMADALLELKERFSTDTTLRPNRITAELGVDVGLVTAAARKKWILKPAIEHRYRTDTSLEDRARLMSRDTEQRIERASPGWFAVNYPRLRHTEIDIIADTPITPCLREDTEYGHAAGTEIALIECSEFESEELVGAPGD
jgi:hypothetical protein